MLSVPIDLITLMGDLQARTVSAPFFDQYIKQNGAAHLNNFISNYQGIARTQSPTNKNYALELPTFGAIVGVSQTEVQWNGLTLEEPPS